MILAATIVTVLFFPSTGVMTYPPFTGSWRGIVWHKNHLGNITALFNAVFLLGILASARTRRIDLLLLVGFGVSWVVIGYARSASGIISALILDNFVLVAAAWVLVWPHMRPRHYLVAALVLVGVLAAVLVNMATFLAIFHRNATLTGRTALWIICLPTS